MKISPRLCFIAMLQYMYEDFNLGGGADTHRWYIRDFVSASNMTDFLFRTDSPTSDPAYWFDWKWIVNEVLQNDSEENNKCSIEEALTLEQGLLAILWFIENKYKDYVFESNHEMLAKDVYADLLDYWNKSQDNLSSLALWQEWLAAVAEAKKIDKVFIEKGCDLLLMREHEIPPKLNINYTPAIILKTDNTIELLINSKDGFARISAPDGIDLNDVRKYFMKMIDNHESRYTRLDNEILQWIITKGGHIVW